MQTSFLFERPTAVHTVQYHGLPKWHHHGHHLVRRHHHHDQHDRNEYKIFSWNLYHQIVLRSNRAVTLTVIVKVGVCS